ncbi:MAG: murein L,D-transpeptidase catalytic domain family protein [Hymenobacteraceae bacterium]|nr:murein L,D-transpeptidase catalytic domain family protein [Hymenobacteraceae bacterium]MDX5421115.1 murein L,D-transpeptidase catalytic domain family protein [Hymenobacteraceae bacterium]
MLRVFITSLTLGLLSFTSPASNTAKSSAEALGLTSTAVEAINSGGSLAEKQLAFDTHTKGVYEKAGLADKGLSFDVFQKAYVGFQNLKRQNKIAEGKSILTVVDFTKSSAHKRFWTIDLKSQKVLFHTLVAHGRNTGNDKAVKFSNQPNSYMSSLGFYVTDAPYYGKHGLSLRLAGMDEKFNSNAMARAIVLHGADYVSEAFVKQNGRLGRSLGCPSVPREISKDIIETIKNKTVLYIHGNDKAYTSNYLNASSAVEAFAVEGAGNNISI